MATKKKIGVKKNAKPKAKPATAEVPSGYREPKRVSIQKASNGFVISTYGPNGEKIQVAKTQAEANKIAGSMLSG